MCISKTAYDGKYEYEVDENNKVRCPVCGTFSFDEPDDDTMCEVCGWINCAMKIINPNFLGPLYMSLEEAKQAYKDGKEIR